MSDLEKRVAELEGQVGNLHIILMGLMCGTIEIETLETMPCDETEH